MSGTAACKPPSVGMSTPIVNLRVLDTVNVGDLASGPYHYFPGKVLELDIKLTKLPLVMQADIVLGGGGLFYFPDLLREIFMNRRGRLVVWGLGLNDRTKKTEDSYPEWFREADLIGVRDWGKGYRWVPCASCMSSLFDKTYEIEHEAVFYDRSELHSARVRDATPDIPGISNIVSLEAALSFIATGRVVVTTSYHGAYWATLLGRSAVLLQPSSSRFYAMKHPPVLCKDGDWRRAAERAQLYPAALEECRQATTAFHRDVTELLGQPRSGALGMYLQ